MDDQEYLYLTKKIHKLTNIDLKYYKSNQMRRRLDGFIARSNTSGIMHYCDDLELNKNALDKLRDFLTINVSEFFRDTSHFKTLQSVILPELLQNTQKLNIWSAGCSNGAEPYSIAIILDNLSPYNGHKILATDIDDGSLIKAISGGPYRSAEIKGIPQHLLQRYLTFSEEGYRVIDSIRKKITFKKHNILCDQFEQGFDLIICRNVVIYFSDEAKTKLNYNFYNSLKENGILFIGATETMLNANEIGFERLSPCFYIKN